MSNRCLVAFASALALVSACSNLVRAEDGGSGDGRQTGPYSQTPPPPPASRFLLYGAQFEGGFVGWDSVENASQVYARVLPNIAVEGKRFAAGAAASLSRFEIGGDPFDRARLEADGSVQLHAECKGQSGRSDSCPWKVRLVGYLATADVNAAGASLVSAGFDPSGRTDTYGVQARFRKQRTPVASVDGIFWRPENFRDLAVGIQHVRASAEGAESDSSGWTAHADARLPLRDGERGLLAFGLGYTKAEYNHSLLAPDHEDTRKDVGVVYSFQMFRQRDSALKKSTAVPPAGRWDLLAGAHYSDVSSNVLALDGSQTSATLSLRWGSQNERRIGATSTPSNEDSSTTPPTDLGPAKPRLGP